MKSVEAKGVAGYALTQLPSIRYSHSLAFAATTSIALPSHRHSISASSRVLSSYGPGTDQYSNPQELLDQLSASSHSLPNKPNSLIVSVSALSHLGHMQFTWPGFLNNVKIAAGKSGTEESKQDARSWVRARIEEDPIGTRSILAQAGQLSTLLSRFTFE